MLDRVLGRALHRVLGTTLGPGEAAGEGAGQSAAPPLGLERAAPHRISSRTCRSQTCPNRLYSDAAIECVCVPEREPPPPTRTSQAVLGGGMRAAGGLCCVVTGQQHVEVAPDCVDLPPMSSDGTNDGHFGQHTDGNL